MAGVKGKCGLKKGQTNNPYGRPVGSKNKIGSPVKALLADFVEDKWDELKKDITLLEPKDRVKAMIDLVKLVVPRPVSEEEKEAAYKLYGGLAHLFSQRENKESEE